MCKYCKSLVLIVCVIFCCYHVTGQTIPVVFHVISKNPAAITDLQIANAVADLNQAFSHTGIYAGGPGANTGISFCLAQIDPNGGITNGITRTVSDLGDVDADIEDKKMKDLVVWDPRQYCNIWLVDSIRDEIFPSYNCGKWTRMQEGGYASASSGNNLQDGIVSTGFGQLLAHEMGHYLSLQHTFTPGNCSNNDCSVDGDGVCDTPPSSVFGDCTPQNSCSSDTLSGFATDVPDLNRNFMCYSTCRNMFTDGQGQKMRNFLNGPRASLLLQNKCNKPCAENILANFTRDDWFPVNGATINFTSTSSGGSQYEWTVNGIVAGTGTNLSYSFPTSGKFTVTLKVSNGNAGCYATYTDFVMVSCGVMARFYADKRIIASKAGILLDSILFTNRSIGAASYQWLLSNDRGMVEQVVSTDFHLNYVFDSAGNYSLRMIATNGACSDTTATFRFPVEDPTVDGYVGLSAVECYQQTKIKLNITICNNGYGTIPAGTPISFYDADPRTGNAKKIDTTFLLPDPVTGSCCSIQYSLILDVQRSGLNVIYAVFNDNGKSSPWAIPNTSLPEKNYTNNIAAVAGFKFKIGIIPDSAILEPGDLLTLQATANVGTIALYDWSPSPYINCTTCPTPIFTAVLHGNERERLIATSGYGCIDSAFSDIRVPVADDFTITIDTVVCAAGDSLSATFTICNKFTKGIIPKGLKVSFYNKNPSLSTAELLSPIFSVSADHIGGCATYSHNVKGSNSMDVFAVVNDKGTVPHILPNDTIAEEKDYLNNMSIYVYKPDTVQLEPIDTTVFRLQNVTMSIVPPVPTGSTLNWLPDPAYALSCTNCSNPIVQVKDSAVVRVEVTNPLGCKLRGQARINIFPPDFTINIRETSCYTNSKTLVKFGICMNNAYDKMFKGIPVTFYDGDPRNGLILDNTFFTPGGNKSCDTFSAVVNTASTGTIVAVVNLHGSSNAVPVAVFNETDLTNNTADTVIQIFSVQVSPSDTIISRGSSVQLTTTIIGGSKGQASWSPPNYLSCIDCLDPVANPPYSQEYIFSVRNEYSCFVTDTAMIRTVTDGRVNLPTAFTPNGDGKNDVFYVLGSIDIDIVRDFSIYDRYGKKVFGAKDVPANNPVYGWNGTVNGKTGAQATYVYAISILFKDKTQQFFKGTITLIH